MLYFCRSILLRKIHAWHLQNLGLKASDCFVLHFLAENLPHDVMEQVMEYIAKRTAAQMTMKNDLDMVDNHRKPIFSLFSPRASSCLIFSIMTLLISTPTSPAILIAEVIVLG